jgi:hypothetical protein
MLVFPGLDNRDVVLSRACVIIAGDLELDGKAIDRAAYWISCKSYSNISEGTLDITPLGLPAAVWEIQAPPRESDLLHLLSGTMDFHATLPHDKIYSLLDLATETAGFMTWRADSSKPAWGRVPRHREKHH